MHIATASPVTFAKCHDGSSCLKNAYADSARSIILMMSACRPLMCNSSNNNSNSKSNNNNCRYSNNNSSS